MLVRFIGFRVRVSASSVATYSSTHVIAGLRAGVNCL